MKHNRYYFLLIVVILFTATTGCSFVKPLEFKDINSFKVEEQNRGVAITTNFTLFNPNGFKFTINKADIDVYAEGVNLGKLQIPEKVVVNSKDEFTGDFRVQISFMKLLLAGKNILAKLKSGKIEITLKGTIDADFLWMHKVFNVNYTKNIEL